MYVCMYVYIYIYIYYNEHNLYKTYDNKTSITTIKMTRYMAVRCIALSLCCRCLFQD